MKMSQKVYLIGLSFALFCPSLSAKERVLAVPVNAQVQNQWCWAATSRSIIEFFEGSAPSQCEIAEFARKNATLDSASGYYFGDENCCTNPSGACNNWNYNWGNPGSVVGIVENYTSAIASNYKDDKTGSYYALDQFQSFIDSSKLTYIRWEWTNGGGHFVIGYGYNDSIMFYMDPAHNEGAKMATYSWIINDGIHNWTHSNLFEKPGFAGGVVTSSSEVLSSSSETPSVRLSPTLPDLPSPRLFYREKQLILYVDKPLGAVNILNAQGQILFHLKQLDRGEHLLSPYFPRQKLFIEQRF